jgi:hypothetical protein
LLRFCNYERSTGDGIGAWSRPLKRLILLQNSFRVLFLIADGAESLSGVSDTDRDADLSGQAGIGLGSADWQTNLASRFRF